MIDIAAIREYTGADDAFIRVLFNQFLSHLDEDLAVLESALSDGRSSDVRRKAHAMLSSARIFHCNEIILLTEHIEADLEAGHVHNIDRDVPELIRMYREMGADMVQWLKC